MSYNVYHMEVLIRCLASLAHCYLRPQQWVVSQYVQNGPNDEMEILFHFLRYWGLQHNWNMCNAFMFDSRHGVKAYMKKLMKREGCPMETRGSWVQSLHSTVASSE